MDEWGDSALLLFNPAVINEYGEWEAWQFATWYSGAFHYRSVRALMEHTLKIDYPSADWNPGTAATRARRDADQILTPEAAGFRRQPAVCHLTNDSRTPAAAHPCW